LSAILTDNEFRLFRKYIEEKCGIDISEGKAYLIETRLSRLLVDSGLSTFEELYNLIMKANDQSMAERVIDAITTNETLWFRDKSPWIVLEKVFLPHFVEMLRSGQRRKIRLWSAAASTGQEAYSTAMCIDLWLTRNGIKDITLSNFEILATDISQTVIEMARNGRYDAISVMRGLDPGIRDMYFKKEGTVWEIDNKIKAHVKFQQFNLQNSYLLLGKFDIVFCRYVLIYFSDILKESILSKLHGAMEEGGALFLGSSELYDKINNLFEMIHVDNAVYYRRREQRL
jgi:chemotaxis protein methyltransferase CheR